MVTRCSRCGGAGSIAVDCPFCRDSDPFEHDQLSPGECLGCHDSGLLEEACPECGGRGFEATAHRQAS